MARAGSLARGWSELRGDLSLFALLQVPFLLLTVLASRALAAFHAYPYARPLVVAALLVRSLRLDLAAIAALALALLAARRLRCPEGARGAALAAIYLAFFALSALYLAAATVFISFGAPVTRDLLALGGPLHISWRDGRTGLALIPRQYDVATQQALYLKQAGSTLLLSREYMQLVRSRLKPGGVFVIYSNAQHHGGQAQLVRQTASRVFRYTESVRGSYMVVASDQPFALDAAAIERVLAAAAPGDLFVAEARRLGVPALAALVDRPRLVWDGSPLEVTDDHPIVEYPEWADRVVAPQPALDRSFTRARRPAGARVMQVRRGPGRPGPSGASVRSPTRRSR